MICRKCQDEVTSYSTRSMFPDLDGNYTVHTVYVHKNGMPKDQHLAVPVLDQV